MNTAHFDDRTPHVSVDPYGLLEGAVTNWVREFDTRDQAINIEQFVQWFDMFRFLAKQSLKGRPQ